MQLEKVIIIGGGIGGLTLARALAEHGVEATVYEQSTELREVGAGISLWSNAMAVLDAIGYGAQLAELGPVVRYGELVSPAGKVLGSYEVTDVLRDAPVNTPPRVVHRGTLLQMLADGVDAAHVVTGTRCESVDWSAERPVVTFEDGTADSADLVVGADGIWSKVRASLWGEEPARYSGEYCFRGIVSDVDNDAHALRELQGRGRRFGLGAVAERQAYWWATWRTDEGFELAREDYKAFLGEKFSGWPLGIPEYIVATDPKAIHMDALYDRPPRAMWSRGAVTLLGDAAHPTTPNLGQGGCMAIEDAGVLAEVLAGADTLGAALARYESLRIPRTSKLVREAYRFGKIGQWRNPVAVWLRGALVRMAPDSVMRNQLIDKVAYDALAPARTTS